MKIASLRKFSPFVFAPLLMILQFLRCFSLPVLGYIDELFSDLSGTASGSLQTRFSYIEFYHLISRLKKADAAGRGTPVYFAYLLLMLLAICAVIFLFFSFVVFLLKERSAHTYYKIGLCFALFASVLTVATAFFANYFLSAYFADLGSIILPTVVPFITACFSVLGILFLPRRQ